MEGKIVTDDYGDRSRHSLVDVSWREIRLETLLGSRRTQEQHTHRLRVHAGRTKLGDIVDFAKHLLRQRRVKPTVVRACIHEQLSEVAILEAASSLEQCG